MSEGVAFALLLLALVLWLLLPLVPALRELLRPTDAAPLSMVGQDAGDLTFFADRFRGYVRAQLDALPPGDALAAGGRLPDGTSWVRLASDAPGRPPAEHVDALAVADHGATLAQDGVYAMEVHARGDIACDARAIVRALLADGACDIGAGADVLRWVHAAGQLRVGADATLHGRATSDAAIELEPGVRFARLRAPSIVASEGAGLARTPTRERRSDARAPFVPADAVRMAHGYLRVDGPLEIPPHVDVAEHLIVRGDVQVGAGARLAGAVKAHGSIVLAEDVSVGGAVVARHDVRTAARVEIAGSVIAEREVVLAPDTRVGTEARPATVAAPRVRLAPRSRVFGAVTTEDGAVLPARLAAGQPA